jgi:hypothetical protein
LGYILSDLFTNAPGRPDAGRQRHSQVTTIWKRKRIVKMDWQKLWPQKPDRAGSDPTIVSYNAMISPVCFVN